MGCSIRLAGTSRVATLVCAYAVLRWFACCSPVAPPHTTLATDAVALVVRGVSRWVRCLAMAPCAFGMANTLFLRACSPPRTGSPLAPCRPWRGPRSMSADILPSGQMPFGLRWRSAKAHLPARLARGAGALAPASKNWLSRPASRPRGLASFPCGSPGRAAPHMIAVCLLRRPTSAIITWAPPADDRQLQDSADMVSVCFRVSRLAVD